MAHMKQMAGEVLLQAIDLFARNGACVRLCLRNLITCATDSMKPTRLFSTLLLIFAADTNAATPVIVDDTFANGNSHNQDLANNSLWLYNDVTNNTRTDAIG